MFHQSIYLKKISLKSTFLTALILFLTSGVAFGQMTADDIERLRQRGLNEGWTFTVGENPATKYSVEQLCGFTAPPNAIIKAPVRTPTVKKDLPAYFDWRDSDAVTPVRMQDACGSCWAFAACGVLESAVKRIDDITVDLSEQWLVSCNVYGYGCGGGFNPFDFFDWQVDVCGEVGPVLETDFPYAADDLPCGCPYQHHPFFIESYSYVDTPFTMPEIDLIKQAIYDYGPILVSVYVEDAFLAYTGGVFNACSEERFPNHAVMLVGWDDSQGTDGVWLLKNSYDTDWGEDGYMRIEYGCSYVGMNSTYIVYNGVKKILFDYPGGTPEMLTAGDTSSFEVTTSGVWGGIPHSGWGYLHYSVNGSPYTEITMTELANNHYRATFPALNGGDRVKFYVSAEDIFSQRFYDPDTATPFEAVAAYTEIAVLEDNFETDQGWTVYGDAASGQWERGVPIIDTIDYSCPPESDYDGSGQCYLTGNEEELSFVSSGATYLVSPIFNPITDNVKVKYAGWVYGGNRGYPVEVTDSESLLVRVSNDAGDNWTTAEVVGPVYRANGGWYVHEFWINDYISITNRMQLRFDIDEDDELLSLAEIAIDAVEITAYNFEPFICGDVDCSEAEPDISDITRLIDYLYLSHNPLCQPLAADVNGSGGEPDISDITHLIAHLYLDHRDLNCS